ncbi:NAD(P)/FAD-dependent oxidoreductase [Pseudooceanicola onchidii]|uniref:NAD(P)/FAD-dependent oxidoreductase n=1 Tax=Pseudooceanicola onchidii TaxID=2562279 RepID=UPI0010AA4077|nr:FAD-binding oxidoreductase [Pseudooceanicola onchidii]
MSLAQSNLWTRTAPDLDRGADAPSRDRYDLLAIGGGFTGLSAALHAARAGASVLVVEARQIGFGGSGRNVGLVNAGLWLPPGAVADRLGADRAARLTGALADGPALVFDLIETLQIPCDAVRQGTLHCAHSAAGMQALADRHRQLIASGAPVTLLEAGAARARVGSDAVHGALFDPRAGTIQPLAYARGLARAARSAGAEIVEGLRAEDVAHTGTNWRIRVEDRVIEGAALIEATNGYTTMPYRFAPLSFFQMATDPLPADLAATILPGGEGCWDTALVMTSFRRDAEGRMIVGAIGSLDHALSGLHRLWAQRKMARLFPQLTGVPLRHGWCGTIANTADHLPRILRLGPNGYAAFGYSGRGIGTGTVFGKALADCVLGGGESRLPLDPVDNHRDPATRLRGLWYEAGALAAHAAGAMRPLPRLA